jgi:arsenate reductase (thioredoxin)
VNVVIFACVHSAGRSQMAAAFFNQLVDTSQIRGVSAGTQPAAQVHPEVVAVMHERGLDLSGAKPQGLTDELARAATLLVTMGCAEQCPYVPGLRTADWDLADPKGQPPERVRAIRDDVARRVQDLVRVNGWARSA